MQKIIRPKTNEELERQINDLISRGWVVDSIKLINNFEVKLTKYSGEVQYSSSIPLLVHLNIKTLKSICSELNIKNYTKMQKNEMIGSIEKYKKNIVIKIYENLTKDYER